MGKDRNPRALTATKELTSPYDAEVHFKIKKADNRADVERANLFAKIDYVQPDESGEVITRREIPMGDLQIRTILLCLVEWDIIDNGRPVPINFQTLLDYLLPEERVWLYNEILDFNPIWSNREATKSGAD